MDRMKETNASTVTLIAAQQDSLGVPVTVVEEESTLRGSRLYIIAGAVLLIVGAAGGYYTYSNYAARLAPVVIVSVAKAPIFVNEREQVAGTGTALLQAIKSSLERPLAKGSVRFLYTLPVEADSIFLALQLSAPGALLRNVNAAGSMAGIVSAEGGSASGGNGNPFFILSVASYSQTFAAMLSWESRMPNDLAGLFPLPSPNATEGTASTTATSTSSVIAGFRDEIIANHDARVYRDAANSMLIVYGYWDQTTLVIARNPAEFAELMSRLATSRK